MGHWRSQRQWEEARRDAEALIREGNSVSEVARALDVDRSTIGRWMTIGCFRLKDLEREAAGEAPLPRPDWLARDQVRKAGAALAPEYAERMVRAQEEQAQAAKERVAMLREGGGKLGVPEVDPDAFARRAVAEAERLMTEGLYDLAERAMRIAERLARVKAFLAAGAGKADARDEAGWDVPARDPLDAEGGWSLDEFRARIRAVFEGEARREAAALGTEAPDDGEAAG